MTTATGFCAPRPTIRPGRVHELLASFENILGELRALGNSQIDDSAVSVEFQQITEQLDSVSADLAERVEFCSVLAKVVREDPTLLEDSEDEEEQESERAPPEDWSPHSIRRTLLETRHVVEEASQITQIIYKIIPLRSVLKHVDCSHSRQSIGKSMMICGIRVERLYELRLELEDALLPLADVHVEGDVDLSVPEPAGPAVSSTNQPSSNEREPSTGLTEAVDSPASPAPPDLGGPVDTRRGMDDPTVSSCSIQRMRRALNGWARSRLFVPSDVSTRFSVVHADESEACVVRLEVAWSQEDEDDIPSVVVDEIAYRGAVPGSMIRATESAPDLDETYSSESCADLPEGPAEAALNEATRRLGAVFVDERLRPALRRKSPDLQPRRVRLELRSVPVLHVTLGSRSAAEVTNAKPFEAWRVGVGDRILVRGEPRLWTTKASAWLAGTAALGVGVGYMLARLLVSA